MTGWVDALRFLLLGATSLTLQTLLVREALFAFQGGEIALGLLFAVWLAAIALGARQGAHWVRGADARDAGAEGGRGVRGAGGAGRAGSLARAGLCLLPWIGILAVFLFRHHRLWLPVGGGGFLPVWSYALLLIATAAPAGWLTGLLFPLLLRAGRRSAGSAYGLEALGSMAGGALASWVALPRIPALELLALWALASAIGALPAPGRGTRAGAIAPGIAGLAALSLLLSGAAGRIDRAWTEARWRGLETGTALRVSRDTPYHQVTIAERAGEVSLFLDGLYQGGLADPYEDSLAAALVLTQHPDPRELLLIAPALFGPARAMAGAPGIRVTLLRADERLDRLVARELDASAGMGEAGEAAGASSGEAQDPEAAVARIGRDPREAARAWGASGDPHRFDVIALLQGGAVSGAGNRLYTREFFADCARLLKPGGLLALTIPGAANVASPEGELVRASIAGALRAVFVDVRVTPGTTHSLFAAHPRLQAVESAGASVGSGASGASEVSDASGAGRAGSPLSWDPDTLAARRARIWTSGAPWPPRLFALLLPRERVTALEKEIDRALAEGARINQDRRPIAYFAQIRLWDRFSGSRLAGLLSSWHRHPWVWSAGLLAALALAGWRLRRRHGPAAVSLAGTGLVGMGADLLALFLYQSTCGTLYLDIGLVVALYMAGLGAGALLGSRWRPRRRSAVAWTDLAWVALLLAWLPMLAWLPRIGAPLDRFLILGLVGIAGVLTALPFPWVAEHLAERASRGEEGRAAAGGLADAIDHAGACCGALFTGTLLVPLLGFQATLALFAGVKLLGALGWVRAGRIAP